jgi:hypothetical protein
MPDWKSLVRQRLEPHQPLAHREEVVTELAAHLEETYETARLQGFTEAAAAELTLQEVQEVNDWHVLCAVIHRAKFQEDQMNRRTRSLWLPALLTLLGASVSLMATQFLGLRPHLVRINGIGITLYWPWLAGLPLCGALGAHLSQRAHGPLPARLAASLSPALIMLIVMLLILPWGLALDGIHFLTLVSFGFGLANWVAVPAFALLLGAVPFLHQSPAPAPRSAA